MKKIFFTAAIAMLCLFISCKDSTTTTTTESSQHEKNKSNSHEIYNVMKTGDVSKLDNLIDKDIVDHASPGGDVHGLDSVKNFFIQMHNNIKDLKVEEIANATDGDYHFSLTRMTGTVDNPFMGMPAGKMDATSVDVVKVKNNKAVEHWSYMDPREMMKMGGGDKKMDNMNNGKMDSSNMNK